MYPYISNMLVFMENVKQVKHSSSQALSAHLGPEETDAQGCQEGCAWVSRGLKDALPSGPRSSQLRNTEARAPHLGLPVQAGNLLCQLVR